jgi:hypothetical protein
MARQTMRRGVDIQQRNQTEPNFADASRGGHAPLIGRPEHDARQTVGRNRIGLTLSVVVTRNFARCRAYRRSCRISPL